MKLSLANMDHTKLANWHMNCKINIKIIEIKIGLIKKNFFVAENYKSSTYRTTMLIRILHEKNLLIQPNQIGNNSHLFYNRTGEKKRILHILLAFMLLSQHIKERKTQKQDR